MQSNSEYIDSLFAEQKRENEILSAHTELIAIQKKERKPVLTGRPEVDNFLISGMAGKMVFIGSRPSMGKTHHCQEVINYLSGQTDVRMLRFNLEMTTLDLYLRELKKVLKKPMKKIISEAFSEEEKKIVQQTYKTFNNPRVTSCSKLLKEGDLRKCLQYFCDSAPNSENLIVLVDHLHIYSSKEEIDGTLQIFNEFKMSNPNLGFIIYFQFKRELESLWRGKPNHRNMLPSSEHIYMTDRLMQYADLVIGCVIPQVVELFEYAAVHKERYAHLSDHFLDESANSEFVKLKGYNRIYYSIVKIRMNDAFDDPRLYCELLDKEKDHHYQKIAESTEVGFTEGNDFPVFKPNFDNEDF